ncbi:MAG: polysaccharide deacetylase family protein [Anaerolineae bacterium]|nr:polysaccharide deacetylase family protein [Anaerolineae bacterium]
MRGIERVKRTVRKAWRSIKPAAAILMYHRIADVSADPHGISVSPDRFAQHLAYIRQTCHPMRLLDLVEATRRGAIPKRAVVITFDDGYVDFARQAVSLLLSAQVPATVFVASGHVDSSRCFWWDELDRLLLSPNPLPAWLRLLWGDKEYGWPTSTPEERRIAHQAIADLLRPLAVDQQQEVLASIMHWSGLPKTAYDNDRAMSSAELMQLAQSGLIDVGAHTVSHPVLSSLPLDDQQAEIVESRQRLGTILGNPVLTFAYPYGTAQDFTAETTELVEAAGFLAACASIPGSVEAGTDLFRLPRFWVNNWDLATFKSHLEYFFVV